MAYKAITFLGTTTYKPTTYVYEGQEFETRFFAEAMVHFFPKVEEVLLFVTPTVAGHENYQALVGTLREQGYPPHPVHIPEAHTEAELWEIFGRFTEVIDQGDTILFDITNSYRSFPFLIFLAAAYLRAARDVTVERIIYGAFEARDQERNRTPVFDLTPFVNLLDWLTATNQFIYTGDARYLASRLRKVGFARRLPSVQQAGKQLETLSLAMMLCRPVEVMEEAGHLSTALEKAGDALQEWARPFGLLVQRIRAEYQSRAVADPLHDVARSMAQQYHLIRWYIEHNQIIQAVTLAREWVITGVGWRQQGRFFLDREERDPIERQLGALSSKEETEAAQEALLTSGLSSDEVAQLKKLWTHLTEVRNDLDHAGMRRNAKPARQLAQEARKSLLKKIVRLAQLWGLEAA